MQKWEYARLIIRYSGANKYVKFIHYAAEGPRSTTIEKQGKFSKEPDYWGEFNQRMIQLGLEGWELVHPDFSAWGNVNEYDLWFKRPID